MVLLRGIRGDDVDGDGVALATELAQGSSAFRADSDGDGWTDDVEIANGTDPSAADTDDDGFPDPSDASPLHGVLYTHVDHQGSVTLATRSDGAPAYRTGYKPFGEASLPAAGYANPNPFGYTGQRFEAAPALYDYGARFYDPQLGRFLQPDSVVPDPYTPQSLNRYSYVLNSPPNWTDPGGNTPLCETCAGSPGPDWQSQSSDLGTSGSAGFGPFAGMGGGQRYYDVGGSRAGTIATSRTSPSRRTSSAPRPRNPARGGRPKGAMPL